MLFNFFYPIKKNTKTNKMVNYNKKYEAYVAAQRKVVEAAVAKEVASEKKRYKAYVAREKKRYLAYVAAQRKVVEAAIAEVVASDKKMLQSMEQDLLRLGKQYMRVIA